MSNVDPMLKDLLSLVSDSQRAERSTYNGSTNHKLEEIKVGFRIESSRPALRMPDGTYKGLSGTVTKQEWEYYAKLHNAKVVYLKASYVWEFELTEDGNFVEKEQGNA